MKPFPQIIHHGAFNGVTGSCHELRLSEEAGILIDCGLFQGDETSEKSNTSIGKDNKQRQVIDFPVEHIKALVVTHVHIDHVGRIPYLLAAGFNGPIYCSEPSAILLPLVLEDAVKIGFTRDRQLVERFLQQLRKAIVPLPYKKWHKIPTGTEDLIDIKLQPAGHILGSAYVECCIKNRHLSFVIGHLEKQNLTKDPTAEAVVINDKGLMIKDAQRSLRIVFSGDLGAPYAPLLPAPRSPYRADVLVIESTYGDRLHDGRKERRHKLRQVIERALRNRGAVLVPAFSIGRTQELLYELEEILHSCRSLPAAKNLPWDDLEIIVDSPLASRFTEAFRSLQPYWDAEARQKLRMGRHPLAFEQLTTIDSHADHERAVACLGKTGRPCVVISAGGMCSGGRIVNYLKALIGDARTDVLFIGYQASGTPGRDIQHYGPKGGYVIFDGQRYPVRAGIHTLSGYSAHADQLNLINFVRRMRYKPKQIILVHGDKSAKKELGLKLREVVEDCEIVGM